MNGHTNARLKLAAALSLALALSAAWAAARTGVSAPEGGMVQANRQPAEAAPQSQPGQQQQENPVVAEIRKQIAGRENQPAEQVFKNIQVLKGQQAGRIPNIMRTFTRALGVRCDFCHVCGEWEKDDKDMKRVARDMMHMTFDINS